ncbi:MAG: RdgB/HAM1 family non-canonical purine NTP pyrophosphatase [Treponema sp.]|jgi:XTP/dITP diphosphohydrolase|nr:RdgB/HAM1 family non-canonical purine NTP pyrophosphatase [Treponema sp.]
MKTQSNTIWFATSNEHKRRELAEIFAKHTINIPSDAGIAFAPKETGATFLENALIKARALFDIVQEPVIADDSGLCIDALDGRPGIFSARYGNYGNVEGKNLLPAERNKLILRELGDNSNRKAHFVCAMVMFLGQDRLFIAQETLEGEIIREERGEGGFGYDPILLIPERGRTVAELSSAEKNRLSHRAKAGAAIGRLYGSTHII